MVERRGLSLIEVLLLVAVLALLVQLLFPWLVASREHARRNTCQRNFRNISSALLAYHEAHQELPPAAIWSARGVGDISHLLEASGQVQFLRNPIPLEMTEQNWVQLILAHLGEEELAYQFAADVPVTDPANETARMSRPAVMTCPSDSWNDKPYVAEVRGKRVCFARGNYGINGGSQYVFDSPGWLTNPRPDGVLFESDPIKQTFAMWGNGVAGVNKSFSLDDFENGVSTTALVNELRAGIHEMDPRGTWALGQIGASITWGHGVNSDAHGPNNMFKDADDVQGCIEMHRLLGRDFILQERMPCCDHCNDNDQATSRSQHPGGVNIAMADGAVRFVRDDVDPGLWHAMHSRISPREFMANPPVNTPAQKPTPKRLDPTLTNSIGIEFVRISPGEFTMGLPDLGNMPIYPAEAPPHQVRISRPFMLGVHEVTQEQFQQVMGYNPSFDQGGTTSGHPVENVTWYEAQEFCEKLGQQEGSGRVYRLPSEAEWEYAARAGKREPYAHNPNWDATEDGIIGGKHWKKGIPIHPVGTYPPNSLGVHDMCGSVFEWTNDWFGLDYYSRSPVDDPPGPESGYLKVVRGWYWVFIGPNCVRNVTTPPWMRSPFIGFRVVCEMP